MKMIQCSDRSQRLFVFTFFSSLFYNKVLNLMKMMYILLPSLYGLIEFKNTQKDYTKFSCSLNLNVKQEFIAILVLKYL